MKFAFVFVAVFISSCRTSPIESDGQSAPPMPLEIPSAATSEAGSKTAAAVSVETTTIAAETTTTAAETTTIAAETTTTAAKTTTIGAETTTTLLETTSESITLETATQSTKTAPNVPEIPPTAKEVAETESFTNGSLSESSRKVVNKLSDQVRRILIHFQVPEPVGFPGQSVLDDPMVVPDQSTNLAIAEGWFTNLTVHGLPNFTIEHVNIKVEELEVYAEIRLKKVTILGNYSFKGIFIDQEGPFNVTLEEVLADGVVYLITDDNGRLTANKSETTMAYENINVLFNNSGSLLQGIVNQAGSFVILGIKPYILENINTRLSQEVNRKLAEVNAKYPTNISPVNLAVLEGRKFVSRVYDPFTAKNVLTFDHQFLAIRVDEFTVYGLSKFSRVGNVSIGLDGTTLRIGVRMVTGKLTGTCKWYYDFGKVGITREGVSNFTVDRLQFQAMINQSMDIRNKPVLDDLEVETGPISVKMDGEGSFDYLIELTVQLLPKMLRYMIIDALEIPIRKAVQIMILDKIDVQKIVTENLDTIDFYLPVRNEIA